MAAKSRKTSMRTAREVYRLHFECRLSNRAIARSCNKSATTVSELLKRFEGAKLSWPLKLSDLELEAVIFPDSAKPRRKLAVPDWSKLLIELKKHKGVTRKLLWEEYCQEYPNAYKYSQFCYLMDKYVSRKSPAMRQDYKGGEKLFIDWAGQKMRYYRNGTEHWASLFVATLGASNYTFAQVYRDEAQGNWNLAHMDCFEYMGGVPELLVPDNCKTGVTKASYYDPEINASYHELSLHYNVAILPARVRKPQDKAKVETAVQIAEREIEAPLRKDTFHSLGELQAAVRKRLEMLNHRAFSKLDGTRKSLFIEVDQPNLRPLPKRRHSSGSWQDCKVFKDYHIQVNKHYYSVPWKYIGETVNVRSGTNSVEVYLKGTRIGCHPRSNEPGKSTTLAEHRPESHNAIINRSANDYITQAEKVGDHCRTTIEHTLGYFPHPEMGFRSCAGILRLGKEYGNDRLEAACQIATEAGIGGYKFINNVLKNKRDLVCTQPAQIQTPSHQNLRGKNYYSHTGGVSC